MYVSTLHILFDTFGYLVYILKFAFQLLMYFRGILALEEIDMVQKIHCMK